MRRCALILMAVTTALIASGAVVYTGKTYLFGPQTIVADANGAPTVNSPFKVLSTDLSNYLSIRHDNTNAYFETDDGRFIFQTVETDQVTFLIIQGNGTAAGVLRVHSGSDFPLAYTAFRSFGGYAFLESAGTGDKGLRIQDAADQDVEMFQDSISGLTKEFKVYGFRSGDAKRSLDIGVGIDAADTVSFDGLSNYLFDGTLQPQGQLQLSSGAAYVYDPNLGDSGATETVDWSAGNKYIIILDNDCTFTFTDPTALGMASLELWMIQDGVGSHSPTWPANVKWDTDTEPTWTTTAGDFDRVVFSYNSTLDVYAGQGALGYSP